MIRNKKHKANVFVKTYGCAFNLADSEIIKKIILKNDFAIVDDEEISDIVILNSCTVKNRAEVKLFKDIRKYDKLGKKVVVSGCVPEAQKSYCKTKFKEIGTIGTNNLDDIVCVVNEVLKGNVLHLFRDFPQKKNIKNVESMRLMKTDNNNFVKIIPVNEGCLGSCNYCKTKQARGNLLSYSIESIKKCMETAVLNGAKEIWLTSQDIACYGFDISTNLPKLLNELLQIEGDYKIRIGMGNPNHFGMIIDDILEVMKRDSRIYKFLHIPMQSGSDTILKEMGRKYTSNDYMKIVNKIRVEIPLLTIASDIIVAYPKEDENDFEQTISILKKSKTNVLNFSRFWLRPNTPAQKIYETKDFIEGSISKIRLGKLKKEFEKIAYKNNSKWIGWSGDVIITQNGKEGTNSMVARNEYYKPIIISNCSSNINIGDSLNVEIVEVTWFDFRAKICK